VLIRVRAVLMAVLLAAAGLLGVAILSPAAQAADTSLVGNLTAPDGTPVEGVTVTASTEDGFSETATSDANGDFSIVLPGGGTYAIEIDTATLPAGIALENPEDANRSLLVLGGEKKILTKLVEGEGGGGGGGGFIDVTGDQFLQLLFDGLLFGVMIALAALGLNLVFGTTGLTNFSHGDLVTLGAFTALLLNLSGVHLVIAAPIAVVFCAIVFGWGQNKILWRPLRRRKTGLIAMMIISIGLAVVLRYSVALFFGAAPQTYKQYAGQVGISLGPVTATPKALILAVLAIITLTVVVIWVQRSRIGKARTGGLRRDLPGHDAKQRVEHGSAHPSHHLRLGDPRRPGHRLRRDRRGTRRRRLHQYDQPGHPHGDEDRWRAVRDDHHLDDPAAGPSR